MEDTSGRNHYELARELRDESLHEHGTAWRDTGLPSETALQVALVSALLAVADEVRALTAEVRSNGKVLGSATI
jgi:hypothetical protein